LANSNTVNTITGTSGTVTLTSGAILDLTGNTNPTPIAPGGGIVFEAGGATVLYSSGSVSGSYMMDNVTLPAWAKLTNTAVVDFNQTPGIVTTGDTVISGATLYNGNAPGNKHGGWGGGLYVDTADTVTVTSCMFSGCSAGNTGGGAHNHASPDMTFSSCTFIGNSAYGGGVFFGYENTVTTMIDCVASGNLNNVAAVAITNNAILNTSGGVFVNNDNATIHGDMRTLGTINITGATVGYLAIASGGSVTLSGENTFVQIFADGGGGGTVTISSGASINLTSSIEPGGGIEVLGGITVNTHPVSSGTYTTINADGSTVPPQA
jgi:hypothetical protein